MDNLQLKRGLDRVNEKLTTLLVRKEQQKITLVKIGIVQRLTGLNKDGMRTARNSNLIRQVKNKDGIFYELESMNRIIIKQEWLHLVSE